MANILTEAPTKWAEAWAPVADRENKQYANYIAEWEATGKQQVAKATDETFEKGLKKLAPLFPKAARAKEILEQRDLRKKKEYARELSVDPTWLEFNPKLDEVRAKEYELKKDGVYNSEDQKIVEQLAKDLGLNTPAAQDLLNVSGRRLIVQNELLARDKVSTFTHQSMQKKLVDVDQDRLAAFDEAQKTGNSAKVERMFMEWQLDELAYLNLNKDTIQALLSPELKRRASTVANSSKASAHTLVSDQVDLQHQQILNTSRQTGSLTSAIWDVRADIEANNDFEEYTDVNGKTVTVRQQIDNELFNTLYALTSDNTDGLGVTELSAFLETGFPHPAGKDGVGKPSEVLFNKDQVQLLVNAAREADSRAVVIQEAKENRKYDTVFNAKINGDHAIGGVTIEELEQQLRETGLISEEKLNDLEDVGDRSIETYNNEKGYWDDIERKGNLLSKDSIERAKTIRSIKLKREIEGKQEALQKSQTANSFPDFDKRFKSNGSLIMHNAKDRSLKDGETLFGDNERLQYELTNLEEIWYQKWYNKDSNDTEIADKVLAEKEKWLTDRGFYDAKNKNPKNILSPNNSGDRPNYTKFRQKRVASDMNLRDFKVVTNWNSEFKTSWDNVDSEAKGETTVERLLNTSNSVLSNDRIINDLKYGMSGELIYKAGMIPGKTESEVLIAIATAMDERGDGPPNLKKLIKNFEQRAESQYRLKQLVDRIDDYDTKTIFNNLGKASPNQKTRFHNNLEIMEQVGTEEAQIEHDKIEKEKNQQLASGTFENVDKQNEFNSKLTNELRSMGYEDGAITELLGQGEAARVVKKNREISKKLKEMGYDDEAITDLWSQGLAISEYQKYAPEELFNR